MSLAQDKIQLIMIHWQFPVLTRPYRIKTEWRLISLRQVVEDRKIKLAILQLTLLVAMVFKVPSHKYRNIRQEWTISLTIKLNTMEEDSNRLTNITHLIVEL